MNIALFITHENFDEIGQFVQSASDSLEEAKGKVNGAIMAVHDSRLSKEKIKELLGKLPSQFVMGATFPVSLNSSLKQEGKVASLFSSFLIGSYSLFPGSWLIVDDYAIVTEPDFMEKLEKQHNSFGLPASGKAITEGKGRIPVGPVVLSMKAKDLRPIVAYAGESWRSRARYLFASRGFGYVNEGYLFSISKKQNGHEAVTIQEPPKENVEYEDMEYEELFRLFHKRTGERPHPRIGLRTLITRLREIDNA